MLGRVELSFGVVVELHPKELLADREAVQVRVRPAHGGLEDVVELRQPGPAGGQVGVPRSADRCPRGGCGSGRSAAGPPRRLRGALRSPQSP